MPDPEITNRQLSAFKRFTKLLPQGKELDLVILKSHLMIEEQLNLLIDERLKNPSTLDDTKFETSHRISLAEALFPPDFQPWLWDGIRKLNSLRNRIAHNIEPKDINDKIDDLIQSFRGDIKNWDTDRQSRLEFTLWSMFDAVAELVESQKAPIVELVPRDLTPL